ncbi:MAG TPA: hypothetical protein VK399_01810 [Longimicrobiaceae bacterium]|nr:hypothetical protein [Longimicrobiaceae bacterium]
MSTPDRDPPFEGGSQPVPHVKDEVPTKGRSVGQGVAVVLGVLAVLAAAVWFLSPILAG